LLCRRSKYKRLYCFNNPLRFVDPDEMALGDPVIDNLNLLAQQMNEVLVKMTEKTNKQCSTGEVAGALMP